jgi:hypothetical protein
MKKVYDYNTKRLVESYSLDRRPFRAKRQSLNEAYGMDDVMDARELHNEAELKNVIMNELKRNAGNTLMLWSHSGNDLNGAVEGCCEEIEDSANGGVTYDVISGRALYNVNIEDFDSTIVIIEDYTVADPTAASDVANSLTDEGVLVICVCRLDSSRAEEHINAIDSPVHYMYSPIYDRQSHFVDPEYDDDDEAYESVTEKFAKYRKLYEAEDEDEKGGESSDPFADMFADAENSSGESGDSGEGEDKDKEGEESDEKSDDKEGEGDDEYVPMTAIIITVAKDDADKCKDEMVEAGISEDGIEILDGEDDDENAKIRVDADYAKELKDYLSGKGIDLEEKIGGEIVDDEDGEGEGEEGDKEEGEGDEEKKDGEEGGDDNGGFGDEGFGDLFGDDDDSSDEK